MKAESIETSIVPVKTVRSYTLPTLTEQEAYQLWYLSHIAEGGAGQLDEHHGKDNPKPRVHRWFDVDTQKRFRSFKVAGVTVANWDSMEYAR